MADNQLKEYENQLADVLSLLEASPDDEALKTLKSDLEELITITKQSLDHSSAAAENDAAAGAPLNDAVSQHQQQNPYLIDPVTTSVPRTSAQNLDDAAAKAIAGAATDEKDDLPDNGNVEDLEQNLRPPPVDMTAAGSSTTTEDALDNTANTSLKKKPSKSSNKFKEDFQPPAHLIPHETDSEAEKNRKRRAIKALKSKWRAQKKEMESQQKQKSWQSFQKKNKKTTKEKSMFSTSDQVGGAKVGVVSAGGKRSLSSATTVERKRHKHNI